MRWAKRVIVASALPVLFAVSAAAPETAGTLLDALGIPFECGPPPQKIVSLSPNLTELLFAMGVDRSRIAGVTKFCDYPPEVAQLKRVGGIVDPSVETIVALRPDLILATRGNPVEILARLRDAGLRVFAFESQEGLGGVRRTMETLRTIVIPDDATRADSTLRAFTDQLDWLASVSASIDATEQPSVYYYDPISPDWTAGAGTHVDEVIRLAGGSNRASDAPTAWPRYALEKLVTEPPDWLLVALPAERKVDEVLVGLRAQPGWRSLPAVQEGRLCAVPADWLMRPGPRVLRAVRRLGTCLHPDRSWE